MMNTQRKVIVMNRRFSFLSVVALAVFFAAGCTDSLTSHESDLRATDLQSNQDGATDNAAELVVIGPAANLVDDFGDARGSASFRLTESGAAIEVSARIDRRAPDVCYGYVKAALSADEVPQKDLYALAPAARNRFGHIEMHEVAAMPDDVANAFAADGNAEVHVRLIAKCHYADGSADILVTAPVILDANADRG